MLMITPKLDANQLSSLMGWTLALVLPMLLAPGWTTFTNAIPAGSLLATISGLVLVLLILISAGTDLVSGKILNRVTYSAAIWALTINVAWGADASILSLPTGAVGTRECLLGGLLCFAAMFVSFLTAGGGGGDLKLAMAIGLIVGVERGFMSLVYTYLLAGVFAIAYVILLGGLSTATSVLAGKLGLEGIIALSGVASSDRKSLLSRKIRMGPFFALGTLIAMFEGVLL